MPVPLSEMGSLTLIGPTVYQDSGYDRYSSAPPVQPSYKDYTLIEDVLSCQTALPPGTGEFTSMPQYNSNGIFPSYHQAVCPPPAQQALNNFIARPKKLPRNQMLVPQQLLNQQSYQDVVNQYNAANPQFDTTFQYPPFAGSVPNMKNARRSDQTIPMAEGFAMPAKKDTCTECLRHVESCNFCAKISRAEQSKLTWIIWILLAIIAVLLIFIYKTRLPSPATIATSVAPPKLF